MKCPKCEFENREGVKFCEKCGAKMELVCPKCGAIIPLDRQFCGECGQGLGELAETKTAAPKAEGERKHVTVLFSDLSGYTAMSERLDPEEVKEITSRIFKEISQVISKYEGFIEKYVGDAVMALFGVPKAHEDDPVRAIRAAREIHEIVDRIGLELEKTIGQTISMHTGINTGLVVTGEVDIEKGTHGVAGDTINVASRLEGLSKPGEIRVGSETYRLAEGYFEFEKFESTEVKGKAEPVQVYRVLYPKEKPDKIHRLSGFRADLIGRKAEMAQLAEAAKSLKEGRGSIISICGGAGTGKSRLVEEFKASLDLDKTQWLEGNSYAYSQNIPYFQMIDLLNRVFQIKEGDSKEKVKEAVESKIESLVGNKEEVAPYVGSLYALNDTEVDNISPEDFKSRIQDSLQTIISSLAQKTPSVFLLEDLHWTDPSSVELLRRCLLEIRTPAIVLCVYRPPFSLFTSHQLQGIAKIYQEIVLQDLSLSEAQDMLESLLNSDTVPYDLKRVVQEKSEGNPFYLEEFINSLIDSKTLIRDNDGWKLTKSFDELDISSTISGVISSRLDRLEKKAKRIIQEASVIGRVFLYEILTRITDLKQDIDRSIRGLEQIDLIRTRSLDPDLEFIFKHALTQEVVYNGLLKKERQTIHERIGLVMEELFKDRLPEFFETLAFHFKKGKSTHKAVDYLVKSGDKNYFRYALEESHQYFNDASELLSKEAITKKESAELLIDLLNKWSFVYNQRGDWKGMIDLLKAHEDLVEDLEDKEKAGMFYAWLGWALRCREKLKEGDAYLHKALRLGEEVQSDQLTAYATVWLAHNYMDSGLLDEAVSYAKKAEEMAKILKSDRRLLLFVMEGLGLTYFWRGDCAKANEIGKICMTYGEKHSDIRFISRGHLFVGLSQFAAGNILSAIESSERTIKVSLDPIWGNVGRLLLGLSYVSLGQFQEGDNNLKEIIRQSEGLGSEVVERAVQALRGIILIGQGRLHQGVRIVEDVLKGWLESGSKYRCATIYHLLGKVYAQIAQGTGPKSVTLLAKNIGFLIKNVPFANKKAEHFFDKAIEVSKEIGAKSVLGQAYLDLGLLHSAKNRATRASECFSKAIQVFEQCEAEIYLKQAKEALASLE